MAKAGRYEFLCTDPKRAPQRRKVALQMPHPVGHTIGVDHRWKNPADKTLGVVSSFIWGSAGGLGPETWPSSKGFWVFCWLHDLGRTWGGDQGSGLQHAGPGVYHQRFIL